MGDEDAATSALSLAPRETMLYLPEDVLAFWFGTGAERGERHKRWFDKDPAFDAELGRRFAPLYERLHGSRDWLETAAERLARVIVLDQFPRNMFRGTPRAFAADAAALQTARLALERGDERDLLPVEQLFLYLPFEHSEALADQKRACALFAPLEAFPETADALRYAEAHRDIIARFGRFPHRNAILGRESTPEELAFLAQPGSGF